MVEHCGVSLVQCAEKCDVVTFSHEAYKRLVRDFEAMRTECNETMLAVKAHHNKQEGK
jgi:hypothetical protein